MLTVLDRPPAPPVRRQLRWLGLIRPRLLPAQEALPEAEPRTIVIRFPVERLPGARSRDDGKGAA